MHLQETASYDKAQYRIRWVHSLGSSPYMGGENVCRKTFPNSLLIGVGEFRTSTDSTLFFELLKSTMTSIGYIQWD